MAPSDDGVQQRAAGFTLMSAVAEAAVAQKGLEFSEASLNGFDGQVAQTKVTDTWRVNQSSALREREQFRGGSGVAALISNNRQGAHANGHIGQQTLVLKRTCRHQTGRPVSACRHR